jgi:hypothetical protein
MRSEEKHMCEKEDTKYDIEQLLLDGQQICIRPQGTSMYPMFVGPEDEAILAPVCTEELRRGDVVLYRRDPEAGGILVMHRICKRSPEGFYLVGDNQSIVEGPVRPDQIRGILVAWERKGKLRSVQNIGYRLFFGLWLLMLPWRDSVHHFLRVIKHTGRQNNGKA